MKLGVWGARADRRGLAIQTMEFARHMQPAKILGVDMGDKLSPYANDWSVFPSHTEVRKVTDLGTPVIEAFLEGLDVVYMAESPYTFELIVRARQRGVRTAVHANHEFFSWRSNLELPRPDLFLAPSSWHFDEWPDPKVLLPFPVARERLPFRRRTKVDTFLHIAGHAALGDRNGTRMVMDALRYVRNPMRVVIRTQSPMKGITTAARGITKRSMRAGHPTIDVEVAHADVADYRSLYDEGDALVLPRRYGGLCLPINEALSLGLPVISLNVEPQNKFLPAEMLVPARATPIRVHVGTINWHRASGRDIAARMDRLVTDPALVSELSHRSDLEAEKMSWAVLKPRYEEVFTALAEYGPDVFVPVP